MAQVLALTYTGESQMTGIGSISCLAAPTELPRILHPQVGCVHPLFNMKRISNAPHEVGFKESRS
jgi:hypothetical protein